MPRAKGIFSSAMGSSVEANGIFGFMYAAVTISMVAQAPLPPNILYLSHLQTLAQRSCCSPVHSVHLSPPVPQFLTTSSQTARVSLLVLSVVQSVKLFLTY